MNVTEAWMAGVVAMMALFAALALVGYLRAQKLGFHKIDMDD